VKLHQFVGYPLTFPPDPWKPHGPSQITLIMARGLDSWAPRPAPPLQEFTRFTWWMQTERRVAANPQTKPTDLGCESGDKWLLPSTSTIAIYYYSARKQYSFYHPTEGGRLSRPRHCSPWPRLYITVSVVINTTVHSRTWSWNLSQQSQTCHHSTTATWRKTILYILSAMTVFRVIILI